MNHQSELFIANRLKEEQLKLLYELDRVCKNLGIAYYLAYGTAIGVVRHKGFIPWDDDIDVCMKNEDLELLKRNSDLFQEPFFFQCYESDPEYGLMISRLRNSNTTLIEKNESNRDINHGIFIDIYPLYNTPLTGIKSYMLIAASLICRLFLYGNAPVNRGKIMYFGSQVLLKGTPQSLKRIVFSICHHFISHQQPTGYLSSLYGNHVTVKYPSTWLFPVKLMPFEGNLFPVPGNVDNYLSLSYGNYMELPPKDKQVFHHDYSFIDFDNSYLNYKGTHYCRSK